MVFFVGATLRRDLAPVPRCIVYNQIFILTNKTDCALVPSVGKITSFTNIYKVCSFLDSGKIKLSIAGKV